MQRFRSISVTCIVLLCALATANDALNENGNDLTPLEVLAVNKLRPLVLKHLYLDYMKEDIYLIRFLRARNLNIDAAKETLLKSINWRKQNKIDNILDTPLDVEKLMPYTISHDRIGRPVGTLRAGEWKIRRLAIAGRSPELIVFIHKLFELASQIVRDDALSTGKNITQGHLILDLNGFTLREHTCVQCMRVYFELFVTYENYYPQLISKIWFVNSPRVFLPVYDLVKSTLSKYTRDSISIYSYDKNEWRAALLKLIADDQLPKYLGGTFVQQ